MSDSKTEGGSAPSLNVPLGTCDAWRHGWADKLPHPRITQCCRWQPLPDADISTEAKFSPGTHPVSLGGDIWIGMVRPTAEALAAARVRPAKYSPEMERALQAAVQQKEEEERKLAAMTPGERERYINEWAARLAPQLVADGCAIDRALADDAQGTAPKAPLDALAQARSEGRAAALEAAVRALSGCYAEDPRKTGDLWIRQSDAAAAIRALLNQGRDEVAPSPEITREVGAPRRSPTDREEK